MKKLAKMHERAWKDAPPEKNVAARYFYREDVLFDPTLSDGAKVLYMALDAYARTRGVCWPKQSTLAARLSTSDREIRRNLAELVVHGKVKTRRRRYDLLVTMGWFPDNLHMVDPDRTASSDLDDPDRTLRSGEIGQPVPVSPLYNTHIENSGDTTHLPVEKSQKTCPYCHGRGVEMDRNENMRPCWACKGKSAI